jgi:hypothetical protein
LVGFGTSSDEPLVSITGELADFLIYLTMFSQLCRFCPVKVEWRVVKDVEITGCGLLCVAFMKRLSETAESLSG